MKKGVEITIWVVSVGLPLTALVLGLLLLHPKRPHTETAQEDQTAGQSSAPMFTVQSATCGDVPVECDPTSLDSCASCGGEFVCTDVGPNDTDYDIEGTYCLPAKPSSACAQLPLDSNQRMQGRLRWTGWAGVNIQDWECTCPYPQYYPMDTTAGGASVGACKRSSALCRNGVWTYPCKRPIDANGQIVPDACESISDEEAAALVGSDPLQNGLCSCDNVPCGSNEDCAGTCVNGFCTGQRLSMNSTSGLPECVPDTCQVSAPCTVGGASCPGGAVCVGGYCASPSSTCTSDVDCGVGGQCSPSGTCSWGKWKVLPVAPYVFGTCECPAGCESRGSVCMCPA